VSGAVRVLVNGGNPGLDCVIDFWQGIDVLEMSIAWRRVGGVGDLLSPGGETHSDRYEEMETCVHRDQDVTGHEAG